MGIRKEAPQHKKCRNEVVLPSIHGLNQTLIKFSGKPTRKYVQVDSKVNQY